MHPDRRRAGRAIRKQRRLERESYLARKDRELDYVISGQFGRDMKMVAATAAAAWAAFAAWLQEFQKVIQEMLGTPLTRNQLTLLPGPRALRRSEVGSLSPTQSGVQRAREAHSASGVRGLDAPYAWVDEPVDWGGWEDR